MWWDLGGGRGAPAVAACRQLLVGGRRRLELSKLVHLEQALGLVQALPEHRGNLPLCDRLLPGGVGEVGAQRHPQILMTWFRTVEI